MRIEDEMVRKVFGDSVEKTLREASEEGVAARARRALNVMDLWEVVFNNFAKK